MVQPIDVYSHLHELFTKKGIDCFHSHSKKVEASTLLNTVLGLCAAAAACPFKYLVVLVTSTIKVRLDNRLSNQ